jgi:hypothetical protein
MMEKVNPEIDIGSVNTAKTYKKSLSCHNIYININYKDDGKIDYIKIFGGHKNSDCGCSFLEAIADLLTFSIRRIRNEHEAKSIVKNLRYHKCHKILPSPEHLSSCVDAIGQVLEKELLK